ncbi:MAG: ATP-grasp domain-containing protein, partial [Kangiella sp.]|nr:ATP-grasp domain-containing protein [Kangiella sp.]
EKLLNFTKEVSIISARDLHGNIIHYSLTENVHKDGILHYSYSPAKEISEKLDAQAREIATAMLEELNYVGVLAIEFFLVDEQLLINEIAPRVHNSGHWTQIGCNYSQFLNHIRAISGRAVASAPNKGFSAMINLLGQAPADKQLLDKELQIHWYNKSIKPNRKVGHININDQEASKVESKLHQTLLDINKPDNPLSQAG